MPLSVAWGLDANYANYTPGAALAQRHSWLSAPTCMPLSWHAKQSPSPFKLVRVSRTRSQRLRFFGARLPFKCCWRPLGRLIGAGHFDTLANEHMGEWLGAGFLVGSIVCQCGASPVHMAGAGMQASSWGSCSVWIA